MNVYHYFTHYKVQLLFILLFAFFLRSYNTNWDSGYHLHPDERAIVLATININLPVSFTEFISPESPLNPHFFAYGSLPLYLLKIAGSIFATSNPIYEQYAGINIIGRFMSVIAELGTIIALFFLGKKLFGKTSGILASFFYTLAVFPIQTAHFYAVDILLTFFITVTLLQLIYFYEQPTLRNAILIGLLTAAALATKISALPLFFAIVAAILLDFLFLFFKQPYTVAVWAPHLPLFVKRLLKDGIVVVFVFLLSFLLFQPYALIAFHEFWEQNLLQSQMTHTAFVFPYTLQYVGITPYLYQLKNVFLWGLGPLLGAISFMGICFATIHLLMKPHTWKGYALGIPLLFFWVYFLIVGNFAVGWMRYMLPLYPLFCLFGAYFFTNATQYLSQRNHLFAILFSLTILTSLLVWPMSFLHIYTKENTRITASAWINEHIPQGATIAIEHWDDGLPLFGQERYKILTLALYDPDTPEKWNIINTQLAEADYIIIASNRLYTPLQKLTNCHTLPPLKCYPKTAQYYQHLFQDSSPFKKIAEFSVYPQLPFTSLRIPDDTADESFTVYDHPKVIIFKK